MSDDYKDIINLPHHVSSKRPQMPMLDRAAQFSPFAALTGYDDAIHETGRLTDKKIDLSEEEKEALDRKQQILMERLGDHPALTVTYFVPDAKKSGGAYLTKIGNLKRIDEYERWMMLTDGTKIPLDDVADIESELFRDRFWMSLSMRPDRRRIHLYCDCKQKQSQFFYMGGFIMKKNLTEIVFILDRSGSMSGLEADTIGGFNSMIEKQRKVDGEALVSTVLFDNMSEVIHDRVDIRDIKPMTDRDYTVRGCTALLDAIGGAIHHIGNVHKYARPEDVPEHTLFIITTDGMENASRFYSSDRVKQMIERQKAKYGWEFLFFGANIDAVETARHFGIGADRAVNYHSDSAGTQLNFEVQSEAISAVRQSAPLGADWKRRIDEDYEKRGKGKKK